MRQEYTSKQQTDTKTALALRRANQVIGRRGVCRAGYAEDVVRGLNSPAVPYSFTVDP